MGPRVRYTPPFWQRSLLHHLSAGRSALLLCGSVPRSHGRSYARRCLEIVLPPYTPFRLSLAQLTMPSFMAHPKPLPFLSATILPHRAGGAKRKGRQGETDTPKPWPITYVFRTCSTQLTISVPYTTDTGYSFSQGKGTASALASGTHGKKQL